MPRWERALVTGASSGIGRELARQLAAEGTRLVVVARRQDRLEQLALELEPMVAVDVLPADLSDRDDVDRVAARLGSDVEPIDLLINNAGFGSDGAFVDADLDHERAQIDVNVRALVTLCHASARRMTRAGSGAIVNISSIAGTQPRAGTAIYGATKAFVTAFSQSLAIELEGTGVTCTAVLPGLTRTEFHEANGIADRSPRVMWMTAADVAEAALRAAGDGRRVAIPGAVNRVVSAFATPRPGRLREKATRAAVAIVKRRSRKADPKG
jgi:short-subunit dehydrogenase